MTVAVTALRRPSRALLAEPAGALTRSVRRRVGTAWALLFFNTLTYTAGESVLHLPSRVGKGLTQGSLPLAILIALTVNPKVKLRPSVFLSIVSLLLLDTVLTAAEVHHLGAMFRTFRLAEYVFALWLLTPWWGQPDLLLARFQLRCLYVLLGSVVLGILISPGRAFSFGGRLTGAIWPMYPTQIAQYAAVAGGMTVVLWLGRMLSGRRCLCGVAFTVVILLLTHTRTALVAMIAGILVAGLSIFTVNARVRRFFAAGGVVASLAVMTAAGVISTWLARGEGTQGLTSLTGRTNFWALVLNTPRNKFQEIFGFGLSNASVNGLPIDSNWLASYMQEGLWGVAVCILMVAFLFLAAFFQPPGVRRALMLFILTYCLIASFTEDAFTDVSTYLLHLVVAASLIVSTALSLQGKDKKLQRGAVSAPNWQLRSWQRRGWWLRRNSLRWSGDASLPSAATTNGGLESPTRAALVASTTSKALCQATIRQRRTIPPRVPLPQRLPRGQGLRGSPS